MTANKPVPEAEPRHVGGLLMIGLVSLPAVFVWLLFRPGYAWSLRKTVLIYAFGPALIGMVVVVAGALIGIRVH